MVPTLSLADPVPVLRADLKIGEPQPGRGESEVVVEDPHSGKFLVLKAFEVSIARMLNGRRSTEEVLSAASQIGLPLSLESFNGFLRKLSKEGFLNSPGTRAPDDISTWEARAEWSEEIRRLFQEALREARADRFVAAKSRLDALLARSPGTIEAQQLLHWVMERLRPEGDMPALPFSDVYAGVEKGWFTDGERTSAANERAALLATSEPSAPDARPLGRGSKKPLVIGAVALLGLGGALLAPLPRTVTASFTVVPRAVTAVTASRAGLLGPLVVAEGQWVSRGTALAQWDNSAAASSLTALEAQLADASKRLKAAQSPSKQAVVAKAKLTRAEAALKKAAAELSKLEAKTRAKKSPALAKAEKKVAALTAVQAGAQKAFVALVGGSPELLQAELAKVGLALSAVKAQLADSQVLAPADGYLQAVSAKPGEPIEAGETLGRLEDSKTLKVVIALPKGEQLAPGATLELQVAGVATKVKIEKVEGSSAEGALDNSAGSFKGGVTGETSFAGAPKSLLGRL